MEFPIDCAAEIPEEALQRHASRLPRKQLKLYSRVALFAMIASAIAAEDAGLQNGAIDPASYGVFLGTFFTTFPFSSFLEWMRESESEEEANVFEYRKANAHCMSSINPMDFSLKTMPNLTAGHIAIAHNAQGFCRVIADGCTGGLQAVGQAFLAVREGRLDIALCGGAEAPLEEFVFVNFCTMDFLARGVEPPESACRPFDAERKGAVLGEGAAMLILEEYEHAVKRGATIHGEVLGCGAAAGAVSPEGEPGEVSVADRIALAMKGALGAGDAAEVDLIMANGDSTRRDDLAETLAIRAVFGPRAEQIPISATKSMHGHLISASGPLELIACLKAIEDGLVPPTMNLVNPDPRCDLDYVPNLARQVPNLRAGMINAVGFFGESASLLVGKVRDD